MLCQSNIKHDVVAERTDRRLAFDTRMRPLTVRAITSTQDRSLISPVVAAQHEQSFLAIGSIDAKLNLIECVGQIDECLYGITVNEVASERLTIFRASLKLEPGEL